MDPGEATIQADLPVRARRQCWECQRRRVVCDAAEPVCNKCNTGGLVCPGYVDKKPLKWLPPGKVLSRTRRPKQVADAASSSTSNRAKMTVTNDEGSRRGKACSADDKSCAGSFVVSHNRRDAPVTPSTYILPDDVSDIVQAIHYYNTCIYPTLGPIIELAKTTWLVPLSMDALHASDHSIRHCLTSCALGYRLNQLSAPNTVPTGPGAQAVSDISTKLFYHRDIALRTLCQYVADEKKCTSNITIVAVLIFMLVDLQHSATSWRQHFDGLTLIINMRGGLATFCRAVPALKTLNAYYCIAGIIGNTTSPAHDLVGPSMFLQHMDVIAELYEDGLFPTLMCPPPLFMLLIRINHLRLQAVRAAPAAAGSDSAPPSSLQEEAQQMVKEIQDFRGEDWVASIESCGSGLEEGLLLVARIWQSAVMIFCTSALQSVSALPLCPPSTRSSPSRGTANILTTTASIETTKARHHLSLMHDLKEGLTSSLLRASLMKCMMWPLIVAGTELRHGSPADRKFVEQKLDEMCLAVGSPLPCIGRALLRRSWALAHSDWDHCFYAPHAFVT